MNFNPHWNLKDRHALFSPSSAYWINYDEEKLEKFCISSTAKQRGTELHELASKLIKLKVNLPRNNKTLNKYVNDCIGFRMTTEQIVYYSDNVFGTADAISFEKGLLRIFDLKTGTTPAKIEQLYAYAALFCLEYLIDPFSINYDLRIYQNDEIVMEVPDPELIQATMKQIVNADRIASEFYSSF